MKRLVVKLVANALFAAVCGAAVGLLTWSLEAGLILGLCVWFCTFHPSWMASSQATLNEKEEVTGTKQHKKTMGPMTAVVIILLALGLGVGLVPLFLKLGFSYRLSFRLPFLASFFIIAWVLVRFRLSWRVKTELNDHDQET